jgi:hypothetical protein
MLNVAANARNRASRIAFTESSRCERAVFNPMGVAGDLADEVA